MKLADESGKSIASLMLGRSVPWVLALLLTTAGCGGNSAGDNGGTGGTGGGASGGGGGTGGSTGGGGTGGNSTTAGGTGGGAASGGSGNTDAGGTGGSSGAAGTGTGGSVGIDGGAGTTGDAGNADVGVPTGDDSFDTGIGLAKVTPIDHASLLVEWNNQVIYVDPAYGSYTGRPKADLILVTHAHGDHLKPAIITMLSKTGTVVIGPSIAAPMVPGMQIMANGDNKTVGAIAVNAVAMYNTTPSRTGHPKGVGNGYVIKLGSKNFYFSGDTECTPELMALTGIDVAFLCMDLPYTMDYKAAAACTKTFAPKVVYPYHYHNQDDTYEDLTAFKTLVGGVSDVRIRNWYP